MAPRFSVQRAEAPPSREELQDVEVDLGVRLPAELKRLLMKTDALCVEAKREYWPRVGGGASAAMMPGFATFGVGAEVPRDLNLKNRLVRVRQEMARAGRSEPLLPVLRRSGDAGTYGFVGKQLSYWSPAENSITPAGCSLLDMIALLLRELETGAATNPIARQSTRVGLPEYATTVLPGVGVGAYEFGASLANVQLAHGTAALQRVYPAERRVHEHREGLELVFTRPGPDEPHALALIRFGDGCTPEMGGILLHSRRGRQREATWRRVTMPDGLVAFPDLWLYRLGNGAYAAGSTELSVSEVGGILRGSKPL